MNRTTKKDLDFLIARLNCLTNSPLEPYTKLKNGKLKANLKNYHLSGAYGGWTVHRMQNENGGVEDVLSCGYVPKRELASLIRAYIYGIKSEWK